MKTAMQELIELIRFTDKECYATMFNEGLFDKALEKEKEQMIDFSIGAYQDISRIKGVSENLISENKILFEEYYNQTYQ
jgi:hypothetical protein